MIHISKLRREAANDNRPPMASIDKLVALAAARQQGLVVTLKQLLDVE